MKPCKMYKFLNYDPKNIVDKKSFKTFFRNCIDYIVLKEEIFYTKYFKAHTDKTKLKRYIFPTDILLNHEFMEELDGLGIMKDYKTPEAWKFAKVITTEDFLKDTNIKEGSCMSYIHFTIIRKPFNVFLDNKRIIRINLDTTFRSDDWVENGDCCELNITYNKSDIILVSDYAYEWMKRNYTYFGG